MGNLMALSAAPAVLERVTAMLEQRFANIPSYGYCEDFQPKRITYTAEELLAAWLNRTMPADTIVS